MEKNKLTLSQKDTVRTQLRYIYENINKTLEEIVYFGKVAISQKLEAFDNLFSDWGKKPFKVGISQSEFQAIKKTAQEKMFKKNKALQEAIKSKANAIQRQFFRNYQILTLFNKNLLDYMELLKNNKNLNKLIKFKKAIGKITNNYRDRRISTTKYFQSEIESLIDGIKKGVVIDDISGYYKLFCDFFEQEIDYLLIFLKNIKAIVEDYEKAEEEIKEKTKIPELKLELPFSI